MHSLIQVIAKEPSTLHYACDMHEALEAAQGLEDVDASWGVTGDADGYAGDVENDDDLDVDRAATPKCRKPRHHSRSRHRGQTRKAAAPNAVHIAVTGTTTMVEVTEPDDKGKGKEKEDDRHPRRHLQPGGRTNSLYRSVESSASAVNPNATLSAKVAKRMRSTPNFGLRGLENLISPSRNRLIQPAPPDASEKEILSVLNNAVDVFLKLDTVEIAEEVTREQAGYFLALKVSR